MQLFRFAVQGTRATSAREWRDLARSVQDLGYTTLFVADHYLGPGRAARESRLPPQHLAPITAMAMAAASTETLRVGCRVFCVGYHVPAVLAKEMATLDLLSDGRLEFGIGAGWSEREFTALGLPFAAAPQRVDQLEEVVTLVKAHWSGDPLDLRGEFATAVDFAGLPLPVQRPRPPIMIGGSRRRVLSFAARAADIVSIANVPFDEVNSAGRTPPEEATHRFGVVQDAAGERFGDLEIESSPFFVRITDEPEAAAAKLAEALHTPPAVLLNHPNVLIGTVDEIVDRLQERREVFGPNYITVQQSEAERFAPVAARLAGK
ncbi:probable F420-dependent oxidoreductase, MSMEG_2516 family [Streptomyces sp. yr375]|uniref:TIGR03621 family F420-dependent LLM class oxidoreductase n=1 Tax=Streptomyces sp. yr375 TaxID=1761906 RepID=UPI000562525D|nr:TIGR03621 family F420-dependent LLM class oxidoreductase [Streptomyces sp. yr375]SEP99878.1 probable F420-dependent oxidoreductase, MSMEG_2516 family [Streptomyces sp. yr375]